jgi:hypothetical protein
VAVDPFDHEPLRGLPRGERSLADRPEQADHGGHEHEPPGR